MRKQRVRIAVILCCGVVLVVVGTIGFRLFADLPSPEDLSAYTSAPSSKIYDRNGELLFEIPPPYTGSHTPVALEDIPEYLRWATVAIEDRSFYQNRGLDLIGILRALWYNLKDEGHVMGGSTITQQLVRNLLLAPDERAEITLRRKVREALLAMRVTNRYSKDEILGYYLNEIYYGTMAYGVEAAAQAYYGKHVTELDLAECSMLAAIPQFPALNPLADPEAAKTRQALVLDAMVELEVISQGQADLALQEKLSFAAAPFPIRAPHFVMYVYTFLEQTLGAQRLAEGGLEIHTTLDVELNETARDIMRHHLEVLALCNYEAECPPGGRNARNAAIVAIDPTTGEVLAMVGSPDYFSVRIDGAVNGATALRQPGSSIKPLTYAAAFAEGQTAEGERITAATMLLDVRTAFVTREGAPYVPLNYDLEFRGPVRLREALASSYNLVAVKVLDMIGINTMTGLARDLGITTFDDPSKLGLAVALGGGEVRLLELTTAYGAFANGGRAITPVAVRQIEDATGQVIWTAEGGLGAQVLDPRVAFLITDVLSDDLARLPTFGEGSVLNIDRPAAVKTGTTTDFRDNWTIGYTPELAVGVWVGNADNEPMKEVSGISGAAPIWHDVMLMAHKGLPEREFASPEGLVSVEVCATSGQLPNPDCPHRVMEMFVEGTQPTRSCTMHQRIDGVVYLVLPPEAHEWAREHRIPQPPAQPGLGTTIRLTSPDEGAVYRIDPDVSQEGQQIVISAETDIDLSQLRFTVDGVTVAELSTPPFAAYWPLEVGIHTLAAIGVTTTGEEVQSDAVRITVQD